jgi:hypothetical protein
MKLPAVYNMQKLWSKGLFTILLLTGFFIFHHSAASSHQRFAAQITECVTSGTYLARGFHYPAQTFSTYKQSAACIILFSKVNFCLFHTKQAAIKLKLVLQTVLAKQVFYVYFTKSIQQSGKNDPSAILS